GVPRPLREPWRQSRCPAVARLRSGSELRSRIDSHETTLTTEEFSRPRCPRNGAMTRIALTLTALARFAWARLSRHAMTVMTAVDHGSSRVYGKVGADGADRRHGDGGNQVGQVRQLVQRQHSGHSRLRNRLGVAS